MTELPIVLRPRIEGRALGGAFGGFFGLVLLVPGLALAAPAACLAAVGVLAATALGVFCASRHEIVFEAETVVERTAFSSRSYPYDGMNALIRRAWTATAYKFGRSGLGGIGLSLRYGGRPAVVIPASWRGADGFDAAVRWVESLPIPRDYL